MEISDFQLITSPAHILLKLGKKKENPDLLSFLFKLNLQLIWCTPFFTECYDLQ